MLLHQLEVRAASIVDGGRDDGAAFGQPPADTEVVGLADEPAGLAFERPDDSHHVTQTRGAFIDWRDADVVVGNRDDISSGSDDGQRQYHRRRRHDR